MMRDEETEPTLDKVMEVLRESAQGSVHVEHIDIDRDGDRMLVVNYIVAGDNRESFYEVAISRGEAQAVPILAAMIHAFGGIAEG